MSDTEKRRAATARWRQARRDAGEVPKERWAHPDDWPAIDNFMAKLAADRREK